MPKPLKKKAAKFMEPPKSERPSDPNRAAQAVLVEHLARTVGQPAANEPIIDPETIIREHMAKLGAKGGKISGAKRMQNLSDRQRKVIAKKAAAARWKDKD